MSLCDPHTHARTHAWTQRGEREVKKGRHAGTRTHAHTRTHTYYRQQTVVYIRTVSLTRTTTTSYYASSRYLSVYVLNRLKPINVFGGTRYRQVNFLPVVHTQTHSHTHARARGYTDARTPGNTRPYLYLMR